MKRRVWYEEQRQSVTCFEKTWRALSIQNIRVSICIRGDWAGAWAPRQHRDWLIVNSHFTQSQAQDKGLGWGRNRRTKRKTHVSEKKILSRFSKQYLDLNTCSFRCFPAMCLKSLTFGQFQAASYSNWLLNDNVIANDRKALQSSKQPKF